jgi:hypothetical protein
MTGVERLKKRGFSTDIPRVLSKWVKISLTGEGGFYTHKLAYSIDNTRFRAPKKPYKILFCFFVPLYLLLIVVDLTRFLGK